MNVFIQFVRQATQSAPTVGQCASGVCNYGDNYYGDQVCVIAPPASPQLLSTLADYARSHG
ncbi:hypothetical protein [Parathalassolituus penaei]|uniref:Uncharacterized protein n=1 Tax=Parathalassolituus penaei TaxID=2997323 RepID=A0A9X3EC08_9GAMM|nr:hypothetical protein [Parathalassolituus penaei]MCY0964784.1 hypothetical protein [Parathalassolituus penaei]